MQVLTIDHTGNPAKWVGTEEAIKYHSKNQVIYEFGNPKITYHGGYQWDGSQSILTTAPIISVKSDTFKNRPMRRVPLTNYNLFHRDRHVCGYCGKQYHHTKLTRDHIVPTSKGGLDVWTNIVTSCSGCNIYKADSLIETIDLQLLYVPYVPNHAEELLITSRNIIGCQMEFLRTFLPKHSRLL